MHFELQGQGDNLLFAILEQFEEINCESNAMVMIEGNLDLKGEMKGGFWSAVGRKLTNGESFFTQSIKATRGPGAAILAPVLPGDIQLLECGAGRQFLMNDGVFLACESTVSVNVKMQSIGRALFAGSGGFFVGETAGQGKLAVNGFGSVYKLDIDNPPDNPVIIDNNHVVAWDSRLKYDLALGTKRSSGFFGSLVSSVTSGEGVVLKFSGKGQVVICSRNRSDFVNWLGSQIAPSR
jgi:uncharacterized protein (TIGR00266 family)|nr:TIGR00266 family protein [Neorhizobium tomejilense]